MTWSTGTKGQSGQDMPVGAVASEDTAQAIAARISISPNTGQNLSGILGIIALLAGVYISQIGALPTSEDYLQAALVVSAAFVLVVIGGFLSIRFLPRRTWGGIVLSTNLRRFSHASVGEDEQPPDEPTSLLGFRGTAITDLHPAGAVSIDGQRIDVVAQEGYLPAGAEIEVIVDEGYRRVVRGVRPTEQQPTPSAGESADSP
jgi:membrane-bound serine protease (ClpP class)